MSDAEGKHVKDAEDIPFTPGEPEGYGRSVDDSDAELTDDDKR